MHVLVASMTKDSVESIQVYKRSYNRYDGKIRTPGGLALGEDVGARESVSRQLQSSWQMQLCTTGTQQIHLKIAKYLFLYHTYKP